MIKYSDFSIEETRKNLVEIAMKDSTPKRYAGLMLEAAEQIAQLRTALKNVPETITNAAVFDSITYDIVEEMKKTGSTGR